MKKKAFQFPRTSKENKAVAKRQKKKRSLQRHRKGKA